MLTVDRLRIQLPFAFRDRAGEIARLVGEELASVPVGADLQIDRLAVAPVEVHPQATDRDVARAVAVAVGQILQEPPHSPLQVRGEASKGSSGVKCGDLFGRSMHLKRGK